MKAVVQRVNYATLHCDGKLISEIKKGYVIYFCVACGDTEEKCEYLARKIVDLRIFPDENGKSNLSIKNIGGEILAVSQFTLLADTAHGNRPGFSNAEKPERANQLYERFVELLNEKGVLTKKGVFGGDMKILQENDGPFTIIYDI